MPYTFLQLKKAAEHALGGVPDGRISSGLIVNRALNHLVNAHSWEWRQTFTTLSYVASQAYIDLPTDFGELVQLQPTAPNRFTGVRPLSASSFFAIQNNGASDALFLGYYIAIAPQTDPTVAPRWRMNITPTPAASQAGALNLLYRKLIPDFAVTGTADDAKVAAIPAGQHDTLYALVRAYAVSMEENPATQEWQLALASLARDIEASSRAEEPILGMMKNTGVDNYFAGGSCGRLHTGISDENLNP